MAKVPEWLSNVSAYVAQLRGSMDQISNQLELNDTSICKTGSFPCAIDLMNAVDALHTAVYRRRLRQLR
jgi:hypothetical protein